MQKGSALIALTLFLAVMVLAITGGWYYINNQPQPTPPAQAPYMPTLSDETQYQNTTVYENPDLGLKLKIPQEYSVKEETEEDFHKRSNSDMRKNFKSTLFYEPAEFATSLYVVNPSKDLKDASLSIWVFENPDKLNAQAFYKKYWYYPFIWGDFTSAKEKIAPEIEFMIGESTASSSVKTYQDNSPKFIYLPKDDIMYLIKENEGSDLLKSLVFTK